MDDFVDRMDRLKRDQADNSLLIFLFCDDQQISLNFKLSV